MSDAAVTADKPENTQDEETKKNKRGKASKKGSAKKEPVKKGSQKGSKKGSSKEEPTEKEKDEAPAKAPKKRGRAKADDGADGETKKESKGKTSKKNEPSDDKTEAEEGGEEEKTKRTKGSAKKDSAKKDEPEAGERKSTRERKAVAQFVPDQKETKDRTVVVPVGTGESLGDIENVSRAIDALKSADPLIKKIHGVLFGLPGVKASVKKNVRQFNGIPKADAENWTVKTKVRLEKMEGTKELKPMCRVLDLEVSGTREDNIERILAFCLHPKSSGGAYKGAESSKRKGSTKKKSSKKSKQNTGDKKPRTASGFLLFSTKNRPVIKAKDPDLTFGELGKTLGSLWKRLSDKEKATWNEKAKNEAPKAKSSKDKPAKKKSKKEASESESDSSSSEEEGPGEKLEAKITEIVKGGDLSELSVKKIKLQLAGEFGDKIVADKGDQIKKFVNQCVKERLAVSS